MNTPPPPVSPDGRFWWDGQRWLPFIASAPEPPAAKGLNRKLPGSVTFACALVVVLIVVGVIAAVAQGSAKESQRNERTQCAVQSLTNQQPDSSCP